MIWIDLNNEQRLAVLQQTATIKGLPIFAIEKDWWVCIVLKAVFQSKFADNIIFKGGTSLSKAYHLIERFSEDIDLIIDRQFLGYGDIHSKMDIKRLRKAAGIFVTTDFKDELVNQLNNLGIQNDQYEIRFNEHIDDTSDPTILDIYYQSLVPTPSGYIEQRVKLELSARSMIEPYEAKEIQSFLDEQFPNQVFTIVPIKVNVVVPIRTFIEKALLLHEEFMKQLDSIRTERLTRHLYDLEKLMDTVYGLEAVKSKDLFDKVVEHRKTINPLRNMDYSKHTMDQINLIPPKEKLKDWEADYKFMQENMIVGKSLDFAKLLERIKEIINRFKEL